jgi:Tfp pilus assembly protein PilF
MGIRKPVNGLLLIFFTAALACGCSGRAVQRENLVFQDAETEREVEYLRGQLRINPDDADRRVELGRLLLSEHMTENAVAEFEQAIRIDSCDIQAHLLLSLALQKRRDPDLARAAWLLERASQMEPHNENVHLSLGQVYHKLGEEEKAKAEFEETISLSEDTATMVSSHLGLAAIYEQQGDSVRANEQYRMACQTYPELKEIMKQAEINRICPAPKYAGEEFREEDGLHPPLELRIKQALEEIRNLPGEKK